MRQRFDQQLQLGTLQIKDLVVDFKSRDAQPKLALALLELFKNTDYNEGLFSLLEKEICSKNNNTGRPGMDLWQIFVLAMFRMTLNIGYDRLHTMANNDRMLRHLMGVETESNFERTEFSYQNIKDNLDLLDESFLQELNQIIVGFGNGVVFKKKEQEGLHLKSDSFVVKSNVHYPTDYNLLFDCCKKSIDITHWFSVKYTSIDGWRKHKNWYTELKIKTRILGKAIGTKGKDRDQNILKGATDLIEKVKLLQTKLDESSKEIAAICDTDASIEKFLELDKFLKYLKKHLDLVERRLIKGETIPQCEKMYSVFETYTEWISKGKKNPSFELGKRLAITSDQFGLIHDYHIMNKITDSEVIIAIVDKILCRNKIESLSVDKGFYSKVNKELLGLYVNKLVMPKKGKCNKIEKEEESQPEFKRIRNQHSAVESNINELEKKGLDRCPDKGEAHFDRYLALGVIAYNLHKIGNQLFIVQKEKQKKALKKSCSKIAA